MEEIGLGKAWDAQNGAVSLSVYDHDFCADPLAKVGCKECSLDFEQAHICLFIFIRKKTMMISHWTWPVSRYHVSMDPPLESQWLYLNKGKAVSKVSRYLPFWIILGHTEEIWINSPSSESVRSHGKVNWSFSSTTDNSSWTSCSLSSNASQISRLLELAQPFSARSHSLYFCNCSICCAKWFLRRIPPNSASIARIPLGPTHNFPNLKFHGHAEYCQRSKPPARAKKAAAHTKNIQEPLLL